MPLGKHKIKGTISKKIMQGSPTRYRFTKGTIRRIGRIYRQRLGFRDNKVVEVSFVPKKRRK
jgi:hypothetical protein